MSQYGAGARGDSPISVYVALGSLPKHNAIRLQTELLATQLSEQLGIETIFVNPGRDGTLYRHRHGNRFTRPVLWPVGSLDPYLIPFTFTRGSVFIYQNITPSRYLWVPQPLVAVRSLVGRLQLLLLPKSHPWVAASEYNRQELLRFGFRDVRVCPNIVAGGRAEQAVQAAKEEPVRLLFTGRISPNKNCVELLEQVARAADALARPVELTIVGDVKRGCLHGRAFQSKVGGLASHRWLTVRWIRDGVTQAQLEDLYRRAWLYVSTSLHEGFGLPVCEAIAHGTPGLYVECGGTESVLARLGMVPVAERGSFWSRVCELVGSEARRADLWRQQWQVVRGYTMPEIGRTIRQVYGPLLGAAGNREAQ